MRIGSPMIYAATQQFGAKRGQFDSKVLWENIPARRFLGFSTDDQAAIVQTIRDHLELTPNRPRGAFIGPGNAPIYPICA